MPKSPYRPYKANPEFMTMAFEFIHDKLESGQNKLKMTYLEYLQATGEEDAPIQRKLRSLEKNEPSL